MDVSNKKQSAGDNSIQNIADTIINYSPTILGITEEKAKSIMIEVFRNESKNLIEFSQQTAAERVEDLIAFVVPKMMEYDQKLEFLKEPSVQRAIQIAQRSAACTDKKEDHEIISELLIERIKNRNDRKTSVFLERAMEIVDKIPDESMRLISVIYFIVFASTNQPDWWHFHVNINLFESKIKQIMQDIQFPSDNEWIEILDTLFLIKSDASGSSQIIKFADILTQMYPQYFALGIEDGCEEYETIKKTLIEMNLPWKGVLMKHPYIKGRILIQKPYVCTQTSNGPQIGPMKLTEEQNQFISDQEKKVNLSTINNIEVRTSFMEYWNSKKKLKSLSEWWDGITTGFDLTSIGRIIAKTNLDILHINN